MWHAIVRKKQTKKNMYNIKASISMTSLQLCSWQQVFGGVVSYSNFTQSPFLCPECVCVLVGVGAVGTRVSTTAETKPKSMIVICPSSA